MFPREQLRPSYRSSELNHGTMGMDVPLMGGEEKEWFGGGSKRRREEEGSVS